MPAFADYLSTSKWDSWNWTTDPAVASDATFSPVGYVAPGVAKWANRSGGIPVGYPVVTLQLRGPTQSSRVYKATMKLVVPTLEVTSPSTATGIQPAPTKAYDITMIVEAIFPERCTEAERRTALSLLSGLQAAGLKASDGDPVVNNNGAFWRMACLSFEPPF